MMSSTTFFDLGQNLKLPSNVIVSMAIIPTAPPSSFTVALLCLFVSMLIARRKCLFNFLITNWPEENS